MYCLEKYKWIYYRNWRIKSVVHRLDRPTTGLVIFAKTSKALSRLNESFKNRETQKTYWAAVKNMPPKNEDTLTHYLVRNPKNNQSKAFDNEVKESKKASLTYKIIKKLDRFVILEIDLHTGRHHQIRAQKITLGVTWMFGQQQYYKKRNTGNIDEASRLGGGGSMNSSK